MDRIFEIRDSIHGFIVLNELERDLINQPAFQRLRRIRQLAWTDMVYPSAMHTRFAHSIGVMEVATRLFDALVERDSEMLESEFRIRESDLPRYRQIVRLAALMHDLGHGPFSHAAEELFPKQESGPKRYVHEHYSGAIIEHAFSDLLEHHPLARHQGIQAGHILDVFRAKSGPNAFLQDIVAGQMDADRMDYLLRDAYNAGVAYGRYDLERVINTVRLCIHPEDETVHVGVDEPGIHAIEGLLIARYMMFTQLYFHKTRSIYDHHLEQCLRDLLRKSGAFPPPTRKGISQYLRWDDWRVLGLISDGKGGLHGRILRDRNHYRLVYATPEVPSPEDVERVDDLEAKLKDLGVVRMKAEKAWYKGGESEILVRGGVRGPDRPLRSCSFVPAGLRAISQQRLYVPPERREEAERRRQGLQQ